MDFQTGSRNLAQIVCIVYKYACAKSGSHSDKHFTLCLLQSFSTPATIYSNPSASGDVASIYFRGIAKTILFFSSKNQHIFFHLRLFSISCVDFQIILAFCFSCSGTPWLSMVKNFLKVFKLDLYPLNSIFLCTLLFIIFVQRTFIFLVFLSPKAALIWFLKI